MGARFKKTRQEPFGFSDEEKTAFASGAASEPHTYAPDVPHSLEEQEVTQHKHFEIGLRGKDEVSPYEQQQRERFALDARSRKVLYLAAGLIVIYFAVLLIPNNMFSVNNPNLSLAWVLNVMGRNVSNFTALITGGGAFGGIDFTIVRLIIVGLAGAALAVAGTAYQGALKNQLACPSTLGVMSGAQAGCIVYILIAPTATFLGVTASGSDTFSSVSDDLFGGMSVVEEALATSQMAIFSLVGSLVVVALVLLASSVLGKHRSSRTAMVIVGQVLAGFIASFAVVARMYLVAYGDAYQIQAVTTVMLGNFDGTFTLVHLVMVGVPIALLLGIVMFMRGKLNLLAFDEEEARSMGIKTGALRTTLVVCCTLLTAVIVAFCGGIGYVGFLIPHLARRVVGPDFRFLLPASAIMGAGFLLLAFFCVSNFTVPGGSISMATTAIGVVLFVVVIFHQRRTGNASW